MNYKKIKFYGILLIFFLITVSISAQTGEKIPPFMGDWEGSFIETEGDKYIVARVIGLGKDEYRVQIIQEFDKRAVKMVDVVAVLENDKLIFEEGDWSGEITNTSFRGKGLPGKGAPKNYTLNKIERKSPTLGRPAPADAKILFDGTDLSKWIHPDRPDENPVWKVHDGILEMVTGGVVNGKKRKNDLITKDKFSDLEMHLEFMIPYQPAKRDQGRGNSGLFIQNFYEIQILDSYGLDGLWNECGALYKFSPPKVNMCFPPGQWQTYDINYTAPKFDASGNKISNAVISVSHNGVLIHSQTEILHPTAHSQKARMSDKVPQNPDVIKIQDHNNIVMFRNIWIRDLSENK